MHLPPPSGVRSRRSASRRRARGQHVEAVGRLVEHDVGRVVHQRARQRGLHALALAEAFGAAVEQRRSCRACAPGPAARASAASRSMPCRRAVVDDVLARREPRVEAARVAEHAHARQRLARPLRRRRCRRPARRPASGAISPASMRSVVVLPAPFGPSRPVMRPSGALKLTSRTACTTARRRARGRARAGRRAALARRRGDERSGDAAHLDHRPGSEALAWAARRDTNAGGRGTLGDAAGVDRQRLGVVGGVDEAEDHVAHAADAITPWPALATTTCRACGPSALRDALAVARRRHRVERRRSAAASPTGSAAASRTPAGTAPRGQSRRAVSYMPAKAVAEVAAAACRRPRPGAAGPRRRPPRSACPSASAQRLARALASRSGRPAPA